MEIIYQRSNNALFCLLGLFVTFKPVFTYIDYSEGFCLPPMSITHGVYKPKKERYELGEVVKYSCIYKSNYLFGDDVLKCGEDGNWQGVVAYCAFQEQIISVIHDHVDKVHLFDQNDIRCAKSGIRTAWNIITKEYVSGVVLLKVLVRVLFSRRFTIGTQFIVKAKEGNCRHLKIENTTTNDSSNSYLKYIFECDMISETRELEITPTSNFSHEVELCEIYIYKRKKNSCIPNVNIDNGGIENLKEKTEIKYGEQIRIYCDKGYRLEGNRYIYCKDGVFVNKPTCNYTHCNDSPPLVINGQWSEWNLSKPYIYGNRLVPICNSGYMFSGGINYTQCQENGSWSEAHITCLKEEITASLFIPILASVMVIIALAVILVLLYILFLRRKSQKANARKEEDIYSEPSYGTSELSIQTQKLPPLPPLDTHPFYSEPVDTYYSIEEEGCYYEPYTSGKGNEDMFAQNRIKDNPVYVSTEKDISNEQKSPSENTIVNEISVENELYN